MSSFPYTILQVVPRLGSGGAERTTAEMAAAIVEAGGRALVASHGGRLEADISRAGGEFIEAPVHRKDPASILSNGRTLARIVRKHAVDLIHARSRGPAWSAAAAARRTGAPLVTTFHGAHAAENVIKRWYNSSLVKGDAVIANSRFTGDRIAADYGVGPDRLKIIPRGADLIVFNPQAVSDDRINRIRTQWDGEFSGEALRFLLPARLTPWKGQSLAIEAAAILKEQVSAGKTPPLRLVLCGGAQGERRYEAHLRAQIDERGVRDMVQLVGECADMPAAFAWADAVIAPSTRAEPFGRVAVEAGAMAKPVIAAGHGGFLETVVDDETGILFEAGSATALAEAVDKLAGDRVLRERLGDAAAARVRAVYSTAAMCDATLNVYRGLLGRGA